jgi:hypothetical protein
MRGGSLLYSADKKKEQLFRERSSSFSHLQSPTFQRKPPNLVRYTLLKGLKLFIGPFLVHK